MVATGVTVGLAEWIIDDTCLVQINSDTLFKKRAQNLWPVFMVFCTQAYAKEG